MWRSAPYDPSHAAGARFARRGRTWPQRIILIVGAFLAVSCLAASGFATYQARLIGDIDRIDGVKFAEIVAGLPQNWLVVGSDNRGEFAGNRTDTIMIVRVDPQANHVDILSLPRDLWIPIAHTSHAERINTAYGNNETPQRLIDTIKLNFLIDIHHYVEIDFQTFRGVVGAVGGVPMYFDKPMRDKNSGLHILTEEPGAPPGCVVLDADQALAFARSRHLEVQEGTRWNPDGTSDHGRISRQQYFMRKMFERAASKAANPKVLSDLVAAANAYIKLDQDVDIDEATAMFRRFGSQDASAIRTWSLPTDDVTKPSGAEVLSLREAEAVPILNPFRGLDAHDADPRKVSFEVLNGSGVTGQADQVSHAYKALGYQAEVGGDAPRTQRTTIRHGFAGQERAAQIERHLTSGAEIVADPNLDTGEVELVTGADLSTVMRRPRPWAALLPSAPAEPEPSTTTTARSSSGRGRSSTSTTTTTAPPPPTPDTTVGVVPGQPPPGVECS